MVEVKAKIPIVYGGKVREVGTTFLIKNDEDARYFESKGYVEIVKEIKKSEDKMVRVDSTEIKNSETKSKKKGRKKKGEG